MSRACRHWGVSRQAYYQQLQHQQQCRARSDTVIELVRSVRLRQPRLGARKLHHLLKQPLKQAGANPVMAVGGLVIRPPGRHQHVGLAQHVQQRIASQGTSAW